MGDNKELNKYLVGTKSLSHERIIFVTGACRSGKTLLSRILGSCANIEWIEEPYAIMSIIIAMGIKAFGDVDYAIMETWVINIIHETILDHVLLRNGNFRPNDLSSIWNYKNAATIFDRLTNLESREDAEKYIVKNDTWFLIDIPETLVFLPFFRKYYSDVIIINVVRNAADVVDDVMKKGWMSDEYMSDYAGVFFRKGSGGKKYYWWLPETEERFWDNSNEKMRGYMYWIDVQLYGTDFHKTKTISEGMLEQYYDYLVRYEDLVKNANSVLNDLSQRFACRTTLNTNALIEGLVEKESTTFCDIELDDYHKSGYEQLMKAYSYK